MCERAYIGDGAGCETDSILGDISENSRVLDDVSRINSYFPFEKHSLPYKISNSEYRKNTIFT